MSVLSASYLLSVFIAFCIYWLIPDRFRRYFLLLCSALFCLTYGIDKACFVLLYLLLIYGLGRYCTDTKKMRLGIVLALLPLFVSKYLNPILGLFHVQLSFEFSLIGISFLSFRAISYLVEKQRGRILSCDFCDFCLYMIFFPAVLSGPIERSDSFINAIKEKKTISWQIFIEAIITILFGFVMKIVFADRISAIINVIYSGYEKYTKYCILAMLAYPLYIYCDFAGYSYIAFGTAKLFGILINRNFRQPYFSKSVKEFWNRWHMSLNLWFRDYLYIPLGGNRKGKYRKYLNILIVFGVSGIWHGAGAGFIIWGLLNGLYQVIGEMLMPFRKKVRNLLHIKEGFISNSFSIIATFLLIGFSWIFFSRGLEGFNILASLFEPRKIGLMDFMLSVCEEAGSSKIEIAIIAMAAAFIFVVDALESGDFDLSERIAKSNVILRYVALIFLIMFVLTFGKYGAGYNPEDFIYFGF